MNTDDSKDYKKSIFNKLTYGINKRLLSYEDKIDNILDKINNINNITNTDNSENLNDIDNSDTTNDTNNSVNINNTDIKKILLSINSFNNKFEILNERMINIEKILDDFLIKDITVKNDVIKSDVIKNDVIKSDIVKSDVIKSPIVKSPIIDNSFYKELKVETFLNLNINKDFIKECLNMSSINGDIKLFKKIYIDDTSKEYYPIRHIKKKLQYWLDNHMIDDDTNGTYIKNIILKNIENCYLKINIIENYTNDMDQFLKNQDHINKLSEEKYKDKFLLKIITLVSI